MNQRQFPRTAAEWNERGKEYLPGHIGVEILSIEADEVRARMRVSKNLCAPNGYLHAGAVVTFADTCCGYATVRNLPEGASGFTTIELKSNFFGTTLEGDVLCSATPVHKGRTTQVWDAVVHAEASGKAIARFRCTQMILTPRSKETK